jgi:hypothetical protein
MAGAPHTDEGVIKDIVFDHYTTNGNPVYRVYMENGNAYYTKANSMVNVDILSPVFKGVTVRLLLTEAHRIWDISVI